MHVGYSIKEYKVINVLEENACVVEKKGVWYLLRTLYVQSRKSEFEKKITNWQKLSASNEYTVELKDFFYEGNMAYVLSEFCEGGDLKSLIEKRKVEGTKFTEAEISKIICDLFHGLDAMHRMSFKHGDLRPTNIWISKNGVYKIGIFYLAGFLAQEEYSRSLYGAPEVFLIDDEDESISFSADAYSLGAVLYEVMAFTAPFSRPKDIKANKYAPLDANLGYSEGFIKLVNALLTLDPSKRPSIQDVLGNPLLERGRMQGVEINVHEHKGQIALLEETVATLQKKLAELEATHVRPPDYSKAVNKSGQFVVEEDGWVAASLYCLNRWVDVIINGKGIGSQWGGWAYIYSQSTVYAPIMFPVRKGDNVSLQPADSSYLAFFPSVK